MSKKSFTRKTMKTAIAEGTFESCPLTDEEMFAIFDIDPKIWEIEKKIINHWAKQYQTKLWLKRIEGAFEGNTAISLLDSWAKDNSPINDKIYPQEPKRDGKLLEIFIADAHFDKLTWGEESGDNYNIKIAHAIWMDCVNDLLTKGLVYGFERILFICGSDLFNSEGKSGATTKGTPQTSDVRYQKSFDYVADACREAIDLCSRYAQVDVLVVPGNHDEERTFYLGSTLAAWYHNSNIVHVDNSPRLRKYYKWGKNLIQFSHGDKIKNEKLPMIMATEAKKMWAETEFRFCHIGHWHSSKKDLHKVIEESVGVDIQAFPSLSGNCAWHFGHGYVGNMKRGKALIFDKKSGSEIEINYHAPRRFYERR